MFMIKKQIASLLLFSFFLLLVSPYNAQAEGSTENSSSRIEAMLVVDVSNSMLESDPNKISNEAMKMFVDMASLKGDKVGVIAYAGELKSKKDLIKLNSEQDKNMLKSFIDSLEKFPNTDLSVGVKDAITDLDARHEKGYRPLIVLIADGNNDLNKDKGKTNQQADEELNVAVAEAKAKGYPIYVIGLNANGDLNKNLLQTIATTTNGKFFETSNANDLPGILSEIFADHLQLKIIAMNELNGNGDFQDVAISIPNANVLEANISLVSSQPVEVKLLDPSGVEIPIPSDNIILSKSTFYSMLKMINPSQGNYTLKVKGAPQNIIDVNVILNYDLQLKLETIQSDDIVKVAAFFEDNGSQIASDDLYQSMKATLFVKDLDTGESKEIPLNTEAQRFTGEFLLDQLKNYELSVKAEGDSFYRISELQQHLIEKEVEVEVEVAAAPLVERPSEKGNIFDKWLKSTSLYTEIGVGGLVLLIIFFSLLVKKRRNKYRGFSGQVVIEMVDDVTGKRSTPHIKKLKGFKGEFSLRQLFQLAPEFSETDQITFAPLTERTLLLFNKSNCHLEIDGAAMDDEMYQRFRQNESLRIKIKEMNQSIYVKIVS